MGKLLVMPGTPEFDRTARAIDLSSRPAPKTRTSSTPAKPAAPTDGLVGRTLMLNLAVCRSFQCGGFQLSQHRPFAIVSDQAQQTPLQHALADGRLVDISGQDPKKGFKTRDGAVSKVEQEDTGLRAFVGRTAEGGLFVAIPKNKTQAKRYEREIASTGSLSTVDATQATGLSGITTEDVPLDAEGRLVSPAPSPEGKPRGRTKRRQRQPRRK